MSNQMQGAIVQECESASVRGAVHSLSHPLTLALSFALSLLLPTLLRAQSVAVTLNLIPPYSAYVYDYANLQGQAVITLTNLTPSPLDVRLEGVLTNTTTGYFVRTNPGHRGALPITLPANGAVVLSTQPGMMEFLDPDHVTTNAGEDVQREIVRAGQLPEGVYVLCVEVYEYNGTQLLSSPNTGCFTFPLYYANPPIIIQPVNASTLPAQLQNPVFSWTPPLGNLAGAMIQYDLLVTPVFPGQNPNDAIIAARTYRRGQPVLFKERLMSTVYVRQPFDLPFEQGKQYAMQVTARDINNNVAISNQGRSEIGVFSVGSTSLPVIPVVAGDGVVPMTPPIVDPSIAPGFVSTTLTGRLLYYWPAAGEHTRQTLMHGFDLNRPTFNLSGAGGTQQNNQQQSAGPFQVGTSGTQQIGTDQSQGIGQNPGMSDATVNFVIGGNRSGYNDLARSPLVNVTVELVQGIQFSGASGDGMHLLLPGSILPAHGLSLFRGMTRINMPTLATATTDIRGHFAFNVPNMGELDFSEQQGSVRAIGSTSHTITSTKWRRVLMVRITTPTTTYYGQPIQFVTPIPGNGDLGEFYCRVKDYSLTVQVAEKIDWERTKSGMEVLLLRRVGTRPSLVPRDEGEPGNNDAHEIIRLEQSDYEVLAKSISDAEGLAHFDHLVRFGCLRQNEQNQYYTFVRVGDILNTEHSLLASRRTVHYLQKTDWIPACVNNNGYFIYQQCEQCGELQATETSNRQYSIIGDGTHGYRSRQLYQIQPVTSTNPKIVGLVKNSGAGVQGGQAFNEAGVGWVLWRLRKTGMEKAKQIAAQGKWGEYVEYNAPSLFNIMQTQLQANGTPFEAFALGTTGSDGLIRIDNLPVEGPWNNPHGYFWVLTLSKPGFKARAVAVNKLGTPNNMTGDVGAAIPGRIYNVGEIWMEPAGAAKLTLVNERGTPVQGRAYYYDPETGQQGAMVQSFGMGGLPSGGWQALPPQHITLSLPSGLNRRIVVVPDNTDLYDRDTLIVNVPNSGVLEREVVVPYKLHRLHFHITEVIEQGQFQINQNNGPPRIAGARVQLINAIATFYDDIVNPETAFEGSMAQQQNGGGGMGNQLVQGLQNMSDPYTRYTNAAGAVDFAFRCSEGTYTFRLYGPHDSDFVTREFTVQSTPGKQWQVVTESMEKGRTVTGIVSLDSAVVAGAKVRYTYESITDEATTDAQGRYTLRRVPRGVNLTFMCSKQGFIGMEYAEGLTMQSIYGSVISQPISVVGGNQTTTLNFRLKIYGGMDFNRLVGFPIEVTAFTELPGGHARINGWLHVPDSANAVFRMNTLNGSGNAFRSVRFTQREVMPGQEINAESIPLAEPVVLPLPTNANNVALGMFPRQGQNPYTYMATLRDTQQGISITRPTGDARGAVFGGVDLGLASFQDNNIQLASGQSFSLKDPAPDGTLRVPVFASTAQSIVPANNGMPVVNGDGQALQYVLHGFTANSLPEGSRLHRDSLVLDTRLHTAIEHVPTPQNDLKIHIGKVKLRNGELQDLSTQRDFTIPLGSFHFAGNELRMSDAGIRFKGDLHANGMVLPVQHGELEPTRFLLGNLPVNGLTLMETVPVSVDRPAQFGYDATRQTPAWFLVVTSGDDNVAGATISGAHLNGLAPTDVVPITSIWCYSNNEQRVALKRDIPAYRLYDITDFTLQNIFIHPELLTLSGQLDLGIPAFPTFPTGLLYNKTPNGLAPFNLQPFAMPPININGVQWAFRTAEQPARYNTVGNSNAISFSPGRLDIRGVISDHDPAVFKDLAYTMTKTSNDIRLVVDRAPQQSVRLGGDNPSSRILMTDVEGEMWTTGAPGQQQWNHFYIKGNMPAEMGFEAQNGQPQRMRFEVRGDLSVENQQVKLKDIETPFGDINMVYDPLHHRLSGQVNVSTSVSNGPSMSGSAAMVIDKDGFYFMTGLSVAMSNPDMQGMAFLLLGDYARRTIEMDALLVRYSIYSKRLIERRTSTLVWNNVLQTLATNPTAGMAMAHSAAAGNALPVAYTGLFGSGRFNGFYVECGASIPFPLLPNFSIDCSPFMVVEFGVNMGADVRLGANFGAGSYSVGFDTFLDASLGGGSSTGYFCFYGRIGAYFTIGMDGVFQSNGNWNVNAYGDITLNGEFNIGGGICSVPCNDWTCLHVHVEGSAGIGLIGEFSNNSSNFRLVLNADNTSSAKHEPPPETEN